MHDAKTRVKRGPPRDGRGRSRDVPRVDGHGTGRVAQVVVLGEVVLGRHGLGVVLCNVDGGLGHGGAGMEVASTKGCL